MVKRFFTGLLCIFVVLITRAQPRFTLLPPDSTGVDFNNIIKENEGLNVLAYEYFYNGGGVAVGDINNDGLPDLYFSANLKPNKLYLNLGHFRFKDITASAGVAGRPGDWKTGVTMADVNGDGLLDIYLCYSGKGSGKSRRNELFINNGNNTFTEKAAAFGLADTACSTQAVFFDYDGDGDLDMYLLNHSTKSYKNVGIHSLKTEYDPLAADKLYRNDNGHFTDVSKSAGITGNPISFGLGVSVADINGDGWPDIYVSNDYTEQDYLYINNRNGTFSEKEFDMLSHLSEFSMGNDIADINNDGLPDIFTLDMLPEDNHRQKLLQAQENYELYNYMAENKFHYQFMRNMLHLNNGNGTFSEIGQLAGISNTDWSWTPLIADFDNDGFKDIYITNGYMRDYTNKDFLKYWGDYIIQSAVHHDSVRYLDLVSKMPSSLVANYMFSNNRQLGFSNVSKPWGFGQYSLSNGAAYADLDNDGRLDIITNNINGPAFIYRNKGDGSDSSHWLEVKLKGKPGNNFGLGAKIFAFTGKSSQLYEQMPTRGYESSVSEIIHIGLGHAKMVDSLQVLWLSGATQTFKNIAADQQIQVVETAASRAHIYNESKPAAYCTPVRSPVEYSHFQPGFNDFKRQPLMPVMLSYCGPQFASADINGDGTTDLFIGSSGGQASVIYTQDAAGSWKKTSQPEIESDSNGTVTSALFEDLNGDGHPDLYTVGGGYGEYLNGDSLLRDHVYFNDGKGNFHRSTHALPDMFSSKSCVAAADINGDGSKDLFVGGRVVPGRYPEAPASYLLINDGQGHFTDRTKEWAPALQSAGMITAAAWYDFDKDGRPDLIIAGEWMPIRIFLNKGDHLEDHTKDYFDEPASGWWNTFLLTDVNQDGQIDIVAGNLGLNTQVKASDAQPAQMIYDDFDHNGSVDPFLCFRVMDTVYPYVARDELLDQLYGMRKKFTSYKSFADARMQDIFSPEELSRAKILTANRLETTLFLNRNGKFVPGALPVQAQFSPVYKILSYDFNKDGVPDLLLLGNNDYPRLKLGKMDANFGTILLNDGKGNFSAVPQALSGLRIAGDVKDALIFPESTGARLLLGINNNDLLSYRIQ